MKVRVYVKVCQDVDAYTLSADSRVFANGVLVRHLLLREMVSNELRCRVGGGSVPRAPKGDSANSELAKAAETTSLAYSPTSNL
jgi:hypothetical protein